jgi:hypothetical protein
MIMVIPMVSSNLSVDPVSADARATRYTYFITPTDGEVVSSTIDIDIAASRTPTLYLDGVRQGRGYSWTWDTTMASDGVHELKAKGGATDIIYVTVDNGYVPPVNNAPVVTITSPSAGSTVSDSVTISVTVEDEDSLVADIYIDGTFVTSANSYNWDTTSYANGDHSITAEATDSGDLSDSDSVTVTVDNYVEPPPSGDGHDEFTGTVTYGSGEWHYVDAGLGTIDAVLSDFTNDVDMYLYRPSDYNNYVVRAYTVSNPETMTFEADENGMWAIEVRMYTSYATSDYLLVVDYTPNTPDVTDPTCDITAPTNGQVVYKTTTVSVAATDDRSVDYVNFYVDGGLAYTDDAAPFSYRWDTTTVSDGAHTLDATAYDGAGNFDTATQVSVTVDQSQAPLVDTVRYALITGVSDYKAISDLSYCDEDASDWYDYLISIGYADENIIVLGDGHTNNYPKYDGYATEANTKAALNDLLAMADEDDIVSYITSGHGSGDGHGNSYICSWDCGSGESGEDGDFNDYELAAILEGAICQVHVFIDHCYSGGFLDDLAGISSAANIYATTTCTDNGYGWDDPDSQNGLWTHWFLEESLISQYGSNPDTALEDAFAYAHDNYPKGGGDEPQEFDGDSAPFIL